MSEDGGVHNYQYNPGYCYASPGYGQAFQGIPWPESDYQDPRDFIQSQYFHSISSSNNMYPYHQGLPIHHGNEFIYDGHLQQQNVDRPSWNDIYDGPLQQQNVGSSSENSGTKHGTQNIISNNNQPIKNSRDRVNEYIAKGNQLRICHPPLSIKPPKYKLSHIDIQAKGHHFVPEPKPEGDVKKMPAIELLPQHVELGGYIFMANNDTYKEQTKSKIFGKFNLDLF